MDEGRLRNALGDGNGMKAPYQLIAAVKPEQRQRYMAEAVRRKLPRLGQTPISDTDTLHVVCYGPSLADTWQDVGRPMITMSGSLKFMADRGVIPDFHIDMDPREHKTKHLEPVIHGPHYLMASCCPPKTWDILKYEPVTIWHGDSGAGTEDWIKRHDPGQAMIKGGSSVGLAAIQIGGMLGCRHFEIHGMDNSLRDGVRHAGPHYGHKQGGITWDVDRVTYQTSKIMSNACAEMLNGLNLYPIFCVFHGKGLMQELVRERGPENAACADQIEKAAVVRKAFPIFYNDSDVIQMQKAA